MKVFQTNETTTCPNCGSVLDAATPVNGRRKPKQGDFSICAYCYQVNVFNADMTLRKANVSELMKLQNEEPVVYSNVIELQNKNKNE